MPAIVGSAANDGAGFPRKAGPERVALESGGSRRAARIPTFPARDVVRQRARHRGRRSVRDSLQASGVTSVNSSIGGRPGRSHSARPATNADVTSVTARRLSSKKSSMLS